MSWFAHWGLGILPAAWRGVMVEGGMRGPLASAMFHVTRLTTDETMGNVTGVGEPPWSWGPKLGAIDLGHKAPADRPRRQALRLGPFVGALLSSRPRPLNVVTHLADSLMLAEAPGGR